MGSCSTQGTVSTVHQNPQAMVRHSPMGTMKLMRVKFGAEVCHFFGLHYLMG